ncbi:hypothetical protein [Kordia sp.]|uniref:hypothetical protein n=1 Tax=Kordia sp. TaxID=1965332 RepID=UPI003B5C0F46
MEEIQFNTITKYKVTESAPRIIDINTKTNSIGPLVQIDKNGVIHITAHFVKDIIEDNIFIPKNVEIDENIINIDINIENKNKEIDGLLKRSHWELVLEPNNQEDVLSLKEVAVNIDFNENIGEPKRGTRVIPPK